MDSIWAYFVSLLGDLKILFVDRDDVDGFHGKTVAAIARGR